MYVALNHTLAGILPSLQHVDPVLPTEIKKQKTFLTTCPPPVFVLPLYWDTAETLHLHTVHSHLCAATAEATELVEQGSHGPQSPRHHSLALSRQVYWALLDVWNTLFLFQLCIIRYPHRQSWKASTGLRACSPSDSGGWAWRPAWAMQGDPVRQGKKKKQKNLVKWGKEAIPLLKLSF